MTGLIEMTERFKGKLDGKACVGGGGNWEARERQRTTILIRPGHDIEGARELGFNQSNFVFP
jgi:hypothetical protein